MRRPGRDRKLEAAGHVHDLEVFVAHAAIAQTTTRAVLQLRGEIVVEVGHDDRELLAGRVGQVLRAVRLHSAPTGLGAPNMCPIFSCFVCM